MAEGTKPIDLELEPIIAEVWQELGGEDVLPDSPSDLAVNIVTRLANKGYLATGPVITSIEGTRKGPHMEVETGEILGSGGPVRDYLIVNGQPIAAKEYWEGMQKAGWAKIRYSRKAIELKENPDD